MQTGWAEALHRVEDGVEFDLEVVPGASRDAFPDGYNAWRKRIRARLQAPPQDGRANAALVGLVAAFFGAAPRNVEIVQGATDRQKRVRVRGLTIEEASPRLAEVLDGGG